MWIIKRVTISKAGTRGEASVCLTTEEKEFDLILNKFVIDLNNGADPVAVLKSAGVPVIDGTFVTYLKDAILQIFQESLKDADVGVYVIDGRGITKE